MSKKRKFWQHQRIQKLVKQGKAHKLKLYNQCTRCGRRRGYIRHFGLCRICFRELAHKGELPGVIKSSW